MTTWLTDDEQRAWRGLLQMTSRLSAQLNRRLQESSGLSLADYAVLVQLTDTADGRLRVFEMARALEWEQSRLSHHLARMQRRGLVSREECASDGRGAFVVLTDEGRSALERAAPAHVADVRRFVFEGLPAAHVATLESVSTHVLGRLDTAEQKR